MKYFFYFLLIFLVFGCETNKSVYWCGDHPCVNKKEKEAYFKTTMIVEKRVLGKNDKLTKSEKDEIIKKIKANEKKNYKKRKEAKKTARLKEKEENKTLNEARSNNEEVAVSNVRDCKNPKGLHQKIMCATADKFTNNDSIKLKSENDKKKLLEGNTLKTNSSNEFSDYVKKIAEKNKLRPYPDINDIPK